MGELLDRRTRKKAQTRELIRTVAHTQFEQRGFDPVTIADIARKADVAVQTVFNHFSTKEELFFDGRVDWIDGPARAVHSRPPGAPPLTALRTYLVETTGELVGSYSCPRRRAYIATLQGSDTLRTHERELVHEAEVRVGAALLEAWSTTDGEGAARPADPAAIAPLVAASWLGATRAIIVDQRPRLAAGADPQTAAAEATSLVDRTLLHLEAGVALTYASRTE